MFRGALCAAWLWLVLPAPAFAQIKVGLIFTTDGVSDRAVRQLRDGFELALRRAGGRLGGRETLIAELPPGDPATEAARVEAFLKLEKPDVVVATSPALDAGPLLKGLSDAGVVVVRPVLGGRELAGMRCLANVFVTGAQADQGLDTLARFVDEANYKRVVLVNADSVSANTEVLRRGIKTEILRQVLLDDKRHSYAPEATRLLLDTPQAVILHAPLAVATRFLKALRATPEGREVIVLSTIAADESNLAEAGEAAEGLLAPGGWAYALDTKDNADFIASFEASFGYSPSSFAVYAFDAGMLLDAGLRRLEEPGRATAKLVEAMRASTLASPRGPMVFSNNNFPIQDFYMKKIEAGKDGVFRSAPVRKIFGQFGDDYAAECALR